MLQLEVRDLQVAAKEAIDGGQSATAREALQQLHALLVKAPAAETFKPGDESMILTNLMHLTQEMSAESAPGSLQAPVVSHGHGHGQLVPCGKC